MDINSLRQALRLVPFQSFDLRLADGRTVHVAHPEFVAIAPRIVVVTAEDNSWSVIEPILIVSLQSMHAEEEIELFAGCLMRGLVLVSRRQPSRSAGHRPAVVPRQLQVLVAELVERLAPPAVTAV